MYVLYIATLNPPVLYVLDICILLYLSWLWYRFCIHKGTVLFCKFTHLSPSHVAGDASTSETCMQVNCISCSWSRKWYDSSSIKKKYCLTKPLLNVIMVHFKNRSKDKNQLYLIMCVICTFKLAMLWILFPSFYFYLFNILKHYKITIPTDIHQKCLCSRK